MEKRSKAAGCDFWGAVGDERLDLVQCSQKTAEGDIE